MSRLNAVAVIVCAIALSVSVANAKPKSASVSRSCLTYQTRSLLEQAESYFGVTFKIVSTCRPGATIAGTSHPSEHRYGKAVDLIVPRGTSKAAVVRWFYENAPGVTMTYANMAHIHFDTGAYHRLACGGCGHKRRHVKFAHALPPIRDSPAGILSR